MARDSNAEGRITSLDGTQLACLGPIVEAIGIPVYVSDVSEYAEYELEESGWYLFARVKPLATANNMRSFARINSGHTSMLGTGQANVTVDGAAGYVVGSNYVDVAVRFEVAAQSREVTIHWGPTEDKIVFRATDLAVRNLDYRTTFYIYDLEPYCTWEYAVTTDTTFTKDHYYYLPDGEGGYELAQVTYGDPIPADTYYMHSGVTVEGMPRNVTYRMRTVVDCGMTIVLPDVPDDGYGCWYEISCRRNEGYSLTLVPPNDSVKVATNGIVSLLAGVNVTDLHYANAGGVEVWRATNTQSNLTVPDPTVSGIRWRFPPTKTTYAAGEALDLSGSEVIIEFADGNSRVLDATDNVTYSPADGATLEAGTTGVMATYLARNRVAHTATVPITVTEGA